jgi:IS5 family transposase
MSKPSSVFRYRIRNWHEYNRALINRDRLTVWFDAQALAGWRHTALATGSGAPRRYADLAVECALVCKSVSHLSLRAAHGCLSSVMELMRLTLPIPDYSTVSRRQTALAIHSALTPCGSPRHVVVDATGLKVYGAGAWRVRKHRLRRRRTWRKLHLGIDERTKEIVAVEVTESRVHDSRPLSALLAQIADPIAHVSGDGASNTRACDEVVLQRGAMPASVPRRTARPCATKEPTGWRATRNGILQKIAVHGRLTWRILNRCTCQSIAENALFRFKWVFGGRLWARSLATQLVEAVVKSAVLNRMTQLGMPEMVCVV